MRRFSAERLTLCDDWFGRVLTSDSWTVLGFVGEGESEAIRIENPQGMLAIAKPGALKSDGHCRAAHEKLAFDLAHFLRLPIPPVVLWDRGEAEQNRYLSISAFAFPQCLKWDTAAGSGLITSALGASATHAVSAMRVFHTWISDSDRKSDHTLVDGTSEEELGLAFIDHAFSMSMVWKMVDAPDGACPPYMAVPVDDAIMAAEADRIAAFPTEEITRLVSRVPDCFLPQAKREITLSNLLSRRSQLRNILGIGVSQ